MKTSAWLLLWVGLALSPLHAQLCSGPGWDAAADFSSTSNPNGVWQYGWTTGGGFNAFSGQTAWGQGCSFQVWGDGNWLAIGKNVTNAAFCNCQARIPSQKIVMHPGYTGESPVLRWTAPSAGSYQVTGQIAGLELVFATTTVTLRRNGSQLWTFYLSNNGPPSCSVPGPTAATIPSMTLSLSAGETIDCIVGNGGNGSGNDSTMVDLTIICLSPMFQTNSFAASADVNGVTGSPFMPATTTLTIGQTANLNLSSFNVGQVWDLATGAAPLIPSSAGAITLSDGQIVNVDLSDPTLSFWFNFLSGPTWGPTTTLSIPFSFPFATSVSGQMVVAAPAMASGYALSQPVRLIVL